MGPNFWGNQTGCKSKEHSALFGLVKWPLFQPSPKTCWSNGTFVFCLSEENTFQILRTHFILILDLVCPPKPVDCWRQHCKFLAWTLTQHSARSSITQIVLLTRLDMTSILVVLHVALKSSSLCWNWKSIAVSPNRHRHLSFYTSYNFSILVSLATFQQPSLQYQGFKYGGRLKLDPQVSFILWTPMDRNLKKKTAFGFWHDFSYGPRFFDVSQKKTTNLDFRVGKRSPPVIASTQHRRRPPTPRTSDWCRSRHQIAKDVEVDSG